MDLSVVIVNWNTPDDLARCLLSLRGAMPGLDVEVLVVDNGSTDRSAALVAHRFPECTVIRLPRNLGFAAGNNVALRQARGRYWLLVNPDCLIHDDAPAALVRYADEHPSIGLLGPRLLYGDGELQPSCRRFPTIGALLFRNTWLARLWPSNRFARQYLMEDTPHDSPRPVDWLSGACLLARAAAAQDFGLLDERYFMYCEDLDWCRQAHQTGWEVVYLPEAVVTHLVGRASDRRPWAMTCVHHRSMVSYVFKNHGLLAGVLATPLIALRLAAVAARATLGW